MNRRKTYIWWACMGSLLFGFFVLMLAKGFTPIPAAGFESRDHGAYELVSERIDAYDSSNWMILTVDENEDVGRSPSLEIDSVGRPHISYYDMDSNALKYAYWSGSSWVVDQIETFNYLSLGSDNSLALNKDDQPQISYVEGSLVDLKYAHLNGSTWVSETVDYKSSFATGSANSLTLDDSDRPHIAYND